MATSTNATTSAAAVAAVAASHEAPTALIPIVRLYACSALDDTQFRQLASELTCIAFF